MFAKVTVKIAAQLLMLLAAAAACLAQQAPPTPNPLGTISGHVLRADTGAPLAKAMVTLNLVGVNPSNQLFTRTAPDGSYQFTELDSGTYAVVASHTGFAARQYLHESIQPGAIDRSWIHVDSGQSVSGADVSLPVCTPQLCPPQAVHGPAKKEPPQRQWVLSGTLRDEDGDPLEGEVQAIQYRPDSTIFPSGSSSGRADDQGNFELTGTVAGTFRLAITALAARGHSYTTVYYPDTLSFETAQEFKLSPGSTVSDLHIVFKTLPTYTIRGTITLPSGSRPNERYGVRVRPFGAIAIGWRGDDAWLVRADGSFMVRNLQPGHYLLAVADATRETLEGSVFYNTYGSPMFEADIQITNSDIQVNLPFQNGTRSFR